MADRKDVVKCSFCKKSQKEVRKLIAGEGVYICDECVDVCHQIIIEAAIPVRADGSVPSPRDIKTFLDGYVIGQDHAKKILSVAVHNHYKRIETPSIDDVELEKSNVLFLGPTGSGKTLMAKTIARMLNVPFVIADATSITEAGYVGDDVESIITKLYQSSDGDVTKTQRGIVYIDEVDKLARRGDSASITRDVSGEGVQQALLKIIEGTTCRFPPEGGRKHPNQEMVEVDTTNILFILGGAFVGLEKIVKGRKKKTSSIGFNANVSSADSKEDMSKYLTDVSPKDLNKFGMIPEFVGRVPVRAALKELTEEELVKVLVEPKNAIVKQFKKTFSMERVDLIFTDEAMSAIAKECIENTTGARGLRSILEMLLLDLQFELPELYSNGINKITIDKDFIVGEVEKPTMEFVADNSNE